MNLEKLEKKVESKVNVSTVATCKTIDEIQKVYRLINNCNKREEKRLQYIEDKLNHLLEITKYKTINTVDIAKQQEILELELKLKELKGV